MCSACRAAVRRFWGLPDYLSPVATKISYTNRPVAGLPARFAIKTKHAGGAFLKAVHADGTVAYEGDMPVNSWIVIIPASTTELSIKLTLDPFPEAIDAGVDAVDYEFKRAVGVREQKFQRCSASRRVNVGDPIVLRWKSRAATSVDIHIYQGNKVASFEVDNKGAKHVTVDGHEDVIVKFVAWNKFGSHIQIRTVKVRDVAPRIHVTQPEQWALAGATVTFSWAVQGHPEEVWLEAPARGERHVLEAVGTFLIKMGERPEEFILMARCRDKVSSMILRATPWYGLESAHA